MEAERAKEDIDWRTPECGHDLSVFCDLCEEPFDRAWALYYCEDCDDVPCDGHSCSEYDLDEFYLRWTY